MPRSTGDGRIIVTLTPASWLTLCGGLLSSVSILIFFDAASARGHERWFALGAACMFGGLLFDALDGLVARRFHWESELGKRLDSLCDAITYLIAPAAALRALGASGFWPSLAVLAMIATGLLRLAHFTIAGNVQAEGRLAYLGLPSYYSHFAVVLLVFVHALLPWLFEPLLIAVLFPMSALFIYRRTFPKPMNPFVMFSIIGALILGSLAVFVFQVQV